MNTVNPQLSLILEKLYPSTTPNCDTQMRKLFKNGIKAIVEHHAELERGLAAFHENIKLLEAELLKPNLSQEKSEEFRNDITQNQEWIETERGALAAVQASMPSITDLNQKVPALTFKKYQAEAQGKRRTMEDAHAYLERETGIAAAIFDGHGGDGVSKLAAQWMERHFFETLEAEKGVVPAALKAMINAIHQVVEKTEGQYDNAGSTAVVCYIDRATNLIYTATLGDSEAFIYREMEESGRQSIPLSCVRDWHTEKDARRAACAQGCKEERLEERVKEWMAEEDSKRLRFPTDVCGVNVSRAIGDCDYNMVDFFTPGVKHPGVIQKPKISVNKVQPGDRLLLCCDGVTDYMFQTDILDLFYPEEESPPADPAQQLVKAALSDPYLSTDNVSALVIDIS